MTTLQSFHSILIPLVITAQAGIIFLIIGLLFKNAFSDNFRIFIQKHSLTFAFLVAVSCVVSPLIYSEVIKFDPCRLCWYQRIFMFPQVVLLGIASWKKDYGVITYSLPLIVLGMMTSIRHYLVQFGVGPEGSCGTVGQSVSCGNLDVLEAGYLTIPMMALTGFSLILVLLFYAYEHNKKHSEVVE